LITPVYEVLLAACFLGGTSLVSRLVVWLPGGVSSSWLVWLQSLAVGLLVGDALLHVLPQALETGQPFDSLMLALATGALALVAVECWVRRPTGVTSGKGIIRAPFARMNLAGDFVHHLVDGIIVAAAFVSGPAVGIAVMLAIALHEVPRELSSASVLVAGGYPPQRALGDDGPWGADRSPGHALRAIVRERPRISVGCGFGHRALRGARGHPSGRLG
jgi:zinc and cadmium transporter